MIYTSKNQIKIFDTSHIVEYLNQTYELNIIKGDDLHYWIYCNGIPTQCIIPRSINNFGYNFDVRDTSMEGLKLLLINMDFSYAVPYFNIIVLIIY